MTERRRRAPERLVLFDIDGTLLHCRGQGREVLRAVLTELCGTAGAIDSYDFGGRTDQRIVVDLLEGAGIPRAEALASLPAIEALYTERLERSLDRERMRILPGVEELLLRLAGRPDLEIALLTGNWERGARSKLERFGLNAYFPWGAFGGDGIDREELPPVAWRRARERVGVAFTPERTLIIGDSRQDVACARAHGIPVLAVATGFAATAALHAAGANWVIDDLRQAAERVEWLG